MIIMNDREEHIVLLPCNITEDKFLEKAEVIKNSYFYRQLKSIYNVLTKSTVDLEDEYKKYYSEYENFYEFLYHKYPHLEEKLIKIIVNNLESGKYKIFRGHMHRLINYRLMQLMEYPEEFEEMINKLLKAELYEN